MMVNAAQSIVVLSHGNLLGPKLLKLGHLNRVLDRVTFPQPRMNPLTYHTRRDDTRGESVSVFSN